MDDLQFPEIMKRMEGYDEATRAAALERLRRYVAVLARIAADPAAQERLRSLTKLPQPGTLEAESTR